MEKEWSDRVGSLQTLGKTPEEAIALASEDLSLDPFITIAPLRGYERIDQPKQRGIMTNTRLGYFPVCGSDNIPPSFVDLNQITTVHHTVVTPSRRVASLSPLAIAHLQQALAMHFAFRSMSGLEVIESAVGKLIVDVAVSSRAKRRIIINMVLEDGATLTFESEDRQTQDRPPDRPARGA
jgi:hypothetical protein